MVLVFAASQPYCALIPLGSTPQEIGRGQGMLIDHPDSLMSRRHACVLYREGRFEVTDLGSRNGSVVDGVPLYQATTSAPPGAVIRLGGSLFYCCQNLHPFRRFGVTRLDHRVLGPELQSALRAVSHIAASSRVLFISGESGAGKEWLAQQFHRASPQNTGPFVAVNCAAIPEGIAERLLFGANKGAFSGVISDSQGYVEAADGGTLFLDEVADLDLAVQAKLLRIIESGELLPLGATRSRKVEFRVCTATHKDLRIMTQESKFRADLFFRIGMPHISVPPLRQRKEEIPWLIADAVHSAKAELSVDVSLVELCMLRPWPGNVRELQAEIRTAAIKASAAGKSVVSAEHLSQSAGAAMPKLPGPPPSPLETTAPSEPEDGETASGSDTGPEPARPKTPPSRAQIVAALLEERGNLAAASRALRVHRTQLRRLVIRYKIDLEKLRDLGQL